jgi:hypothetical protein
LKRPFKVSVDALLQKTFPVRFPWAQGFIVMSSQKVVELEKLSATESSSVEPFPRSKFDQRELLHPTPLPL